MSIEESKEFDKIPCNILRPGDIIVLEEDKNKYQYVKIEGISTAKPGKHGSTKFLIKGSNILTRKRHEISLVSGSKAVTAKLKRTEYSLIDIYEEDINVTSRGGSGDEEFETLKISDFSEKDIDALENSLDREGDSDVTFVVLSAPKLSIVEEIRKNGKVVTR